VVGSFGHDEQVAIASAVADVIRVEFVADTDSVSLPDFSIRDGGAVVTLGAIAEDGGGVRLGISFTCGARCAEGNTLVLGQSSGGAWAVDRVTGPGWTS
jgi:hypothetical protein